MKKFIYILAVSMFGMMGCSEDTITYINPTPGEEPSEVIAELGFRREHLVHPGRRTQCRHRLQELGRRGRRRYPDQRGLEIHGHRRGMAHHRKRRRGRPAYPELRKQQGRREAELDGHRDGRRQNRDDRRFAKCLRHARNLRFGKQLPDSSTRRTDRLVRGFVHRRRLGLRNKGLPVAARRTRRQERYGYARPQRRNRRQGDYLRADCRQGGGKPGL